MSTSLGGNGAEAIRKCWKRIDELGNENRDLRAENERLRAAAQEACDRNLVRETINGIRIVRVAMRPDTGSLRALAAALVAREEAR